MDNHHSNAPALSFGWSKRSAEGLLLVAICVVALASRVGVAVLTTSWRFPTDQNYWNFGYEMGQIAASLASGDGFGWPDWSSHPKGPTAWMPPIYPLVMGVIFKIFGIYTDQAAIVLLSLQTMFSVLTIVFLYKIGKGIFSARVGLLGAFFFAIYPPSIHFAVQKVWSTTLFACCLLLIILTLLKLKKQMTLANGTWLGALIGFTALVDPIIVISYPVVFLWLYVNSNRDGFATLKILSLTAIIFFLSISPWIIRNRVVFGQFAFIKSNFGNELFLGNNAYASGNFKVPEAQETLTGADKAFLTFADEAERNKFLLHKAITFIQEQPLQFLKLTMTRFVHYWTFMMQPADGSAKTLSFLIYFALLVSGALGLLLSDLRLAKVQLLALFVMLLPLPYYFTVIGLFRYRFPVEVVLVVPAAYSAYRFFLSVRGRRFLSAVRQAPEYSAELDSRK